MAVKPSTSQSQHRGYIPAFIILVSLGILGYWLLQGQFYQTTYDAYISGNLVSISPTISGRIDGVLVKNNEFVVKGQPIATVNRTIAYFNLKSAEQNLIEATKKINEMQETTMILQSNAKTALAIAQKHLIQAQTDYKKLLNLYDQNATTDDALEKSQIIVEKANDTLADINLQNDEAMSLPTINDFYEHPLIREATEQLRNAYIDWFNSIIYAPETGYIHQNQIQVGDDVNPNMVVMTLVPLNQMWVNATFKNTKNIRNGQSVTLTSLKYGHQIKYQGIVTGLTTEPNTHITSVRIAINPDQLIQYPLHLGFSMDAIVNTHNRQGQLTPIVTPTPVYETHDYHHLIDEADQLATQIVLNNIATQPMLVGHS